MSKLIDFLYSIKKIVMYFDTLDSEEQISFLIKPILKVLQEAGGELDKSELRERICDMDERIAEFEQKLYTSKKTGNQYKKFNFKFNFAIKELNYVNLLSYVPYNPQITLTQQGIAINITTLDVEADVREKAKAYWEESRLKKKLRDKSLSELEEDTERDTVADREPIDDFRTELQQSIAKMSPLKFEQFARLLLTKMGVKFTEKGIKVSNDGGIDGYGYHRDDDDFRITRVVIQCKRYNTNKVGEPEINQFLGAMSKFQADYGVFITNSLFTEQARRAAAEGKPITLIDGSELINLVIKYRVNITPVTTYILGDFYLEE